MHGQPDALDYLLVVLVLVEAVVVQVAQETEKLSEFEVRKLVGGTRIELDKADLDLFFDLFKDKAL